MAQIFFMLGQGRTATGHLGRLLQRHPRIALAPDSLFVLDMERKYGAGPWNRRRIDAFCRELLRQPSMGAYRLDRRRLAERLHERGSRLSYPEVCRAVFDSYVQDSLGRSEVSWVGNQDPLYALQVDQLDRVLPVARYVHITRDYRDEIFDRAHREPTAAASAEQHPAGRGSRRPEKKGLWSWLACKAGLEHPAALAQRWKQYNQRILELSRYAPERTLWLRHEDLLAYPEHELARICRFLDLAFDPVLLTGGGLDESPPVPSAEAVLARDRPASDGDARWHQLPELALKQAEAVCGEFGERFGYRAAVRGHSGLSLSAHLLALCGATSVVAERAAVRVLPPALRARLAHAYTRVQTTLHGAKLSSGVSP